MDASQPTATPPHHRGLRDRVAGLSPRYSVDACGDRRDYAVRHRCSIEPGDEPRSFRRSLARRSSELAQDEPAARAAPEGNLRGPELAEGRGHALLVGAATARRFPKSRTGA